MRSSRRLVLLVASVVAATACGSEVDGRRAAGETSSGQGGQATSTLSTGGGGIGGGSGGAGGEGLSGPVHTTTVLVVGLAGPASGFTVAVNDADGGLVSTVTTGADGKATVAVPLGGMVATYPPDKGFLRTMQGFVDPPDGSTITVEPIEASHTKPATDYDVTLSGYPPSTTNLEVHTCASSSTEAAGVGSTSVAVNDHECLGFDKNTIVAIALDAAQQPVAWGRADVDPDPGSVVPVAIAVDQPGFTTSTETIAPIPDTATFAVFARVARRGNAPRFELNDIVPTPPPSLQWSVTLPATPIAFFTSEAVGFVEGAYVRGGWRVRQQAALPPTSVFDPSGFAAVLVEPIDETDPIHPVSSWTVGPGATADAIRFFLIQDTRSYSVLAPASHPTSFRLPDVPASVPDFAPDAVDSWTVEVAYVDDQNAAGWDELYPFLPLGDIDVVATSGSTAP